MNMPRLLSTAVAAFALAGAAIAQTPAASAAPPPAAVPPAAAPAPTLPSVSLKPSGDIVDTLKASGQFAILLKALDVANLTDFLKGAGPYTLLAPTDAAFKAMPAAQLDALMKNASGMQALLAYHLIAVGVSPAKLQGAKSSVATAAGPEVALDGTETPARVNGAAIVGQAQVSNGDVYAIDRVLSPQAASAANAAGTPAAAAVASAAPH